jgi:hypothetical protein
MSPTTRRTNFSTGDVGDVLRVQCWRIARLFEQGLLPEPPRVGGRRLIPGSMIPGIVALLRERGCDVQYEPSKWEEVLESDGE